MRDRLRRRGAAIGSSPAEQPGKPGQRSYKVYLRQLPILKLTANLVLMSQKTPGRHCNLQAREKPAGGRMSLAFH